MAIKCRNYQSFGRSVIMKMHAWNSQIVYEISGAIFYGSQLFRNLGINQVNNSRCNMLGLMFGPFFQVHVSIYFNFSLRYIIYMYHVSVRDTNLAQLSICDKKVQFRDIEPSSIFEIHFWINCTPFHSVSLGDHWTFRNIRASWI